MVDKRIGRLRGLVVGDAVCISTRFTKYFDYRVSRITPTGIITVENPEGSIYVFNPSGHLRGVDEYDRTELYPYNEVEHLNHAENTLSNLNAIKTDELSKIVDLASTLSNAEGCVDEDFVLKLRNIRYMLAELTLRV